MNFFKQIRDSIYNQKFYQELLTKPMGYSIRYFFFFSLLFATLFTVKFSVLQLPSINKALNSFAQEAVNVFPEKLEVTLKDGMVATNASEPYVIAMPKVMQEGDEELGKIVNLIVIDTQAEPSIEVFKNQDTLFLLTKNYLVYEKNKSQIINQELREVPDMIISRSALLGFVEKFSPYLKIFIPVIIGFVFIGGLFLMFFQTIYLIFGALAVWIVASIKGVTIGYQKAYQLGLHLITLLILVELVHALDVFMLFTLALAIMAILNINKVAKADESINDQQVDSGESVK